MYSLMAGNILLSSPFQLDYGTVLPMLMVVIMDYGKVLRDFAIKLFASAVVTVVCIGNNERWPYMQIMSWYFYSNRTRRQFLTMNMINVYDKGL